MLIRKRYRFDALHSDRRWVMDRIEKVQRITADTLVPVAFELRRDHIWRCSPKIVDASHLQRGLSFEEKAILATFLDRCAKQGLVHGDIHGKNILDSRQGIALIDWEPDLIQTVSGRRSMMVSWPWISPADRRRFTVSVRTDLFCFWRLLCGINSPKHMPSDWMAIEESFINTGEPFSALFETWRQRTEASMRLSP